MNNERMSAAMYDQLYKENVEALEQSLGRQLTDRERDALDKHLYDEISFLVVDIIDDFGRFFLEEWS